MSKSNTINNNNNENNNNKSNNNNDNIEIISKGIKGAFPDPTEDVFWQKVSTVINENDSNDVDAIWNPHKKELNQKPKNDGFVITPPPPHPAANSYARHSRKSSRVSWELQTDSERHVELLETKLNDVISKQNRTRSRPGAMDFNGTTLGYYSEEEIGAGTGFDDDDEADLHLNHNPQESDEGLWLLWKNRSTTDQPSEENNDTATTTSNQWYIPILTSSDNNNNNNNDNVENGPSLRRLRMRNENYVTGYREDSNPNEFPFYDDDDGFSDELLNRAKRKREREYLNFNARSYECCGCNTTNGLCAGLWKSWCCNFVCLPTILFVREKCCCGICGLEDD